MTESETAPLLGNHEEPSEVGEEKGWRERAAAALKSRPFHSFIFSLIIIDCLIVIVELAFVLLSSSCGGDEDFPAWLQVLRSYESFELKWFALFCILGALTPLCGYRRSFRAGNPSVGLVRNPDSPTISSCTDQTVLLF